MHKINYERYIGKSYVKKNVIIKEITLCNYLIIHNNSTNLITNSMQDELDFIFLMPVYPLIEFNFLLKVIANIYK